MLDFCQLLPHCKKDAKLDTKSNRNVINEVADMKNCSSAIFFEARKHKDLYVWIAKTPSGPSVKFHVINIHTMAELKLSGNHLKGSRPVLSFDSNFDNEPHLQLIKEIFTQIFATPMLHQKSKPFFDHVVAFSVVDGRVWLRNYQVGPDPTAKKQSPDAVTLIEVGPRACFNPIRIFSGSFGGPVIYDNHLYVSPNLIRSALRGRDQHKYIAKIESRQDRKKHKAENQLPKGELTGVFKEEWDD